jgi:DNA-directed RNA polymerase specialized sigma24 family protein
MDDDDREARSPAQSPWGNGSAFAALVEPYRAELQVHCYRLVGSHAQAEDLLQETLLATWRDLSSFARPWSLRNWLYRVATSRCLNALCPNEWTTPMMGAESQFPAPAAWLEPSSLEPYPDAMLGGISDLTPGPDAKYNGRDAISLAFVGAIQSLPPGHELC